MCSGRLLAEHDLDVVGQGSRGHAGRPSGERMLPGDDRDQPYGYEVLALEPLRVRSRTDHADLAGAVEHQRGHRGQYPGVQAQLDRGEFLGAFPAQVDNGADRQDGLHRQRHAGFEPAHEPLGHPLERVDVGADAPGAAEQGGSAS